MITAKVLGLLILENVIVETKFTLVLCDNRNSHITIMLFDIIIIMIVDP